MNEVVFYGTEKFKYSVNTNAEVNRQSKITSKVFKLKLSTSKNKQGYKYSFYHIDHKIFGIEDLMLKTFLPNVDPKVYWLKRKNTDIEEYSLANLHLVKKAVENHRDYRSRKVIYINYDLKKAYIYKNLKLCSEKLGYSYQYLSRCIRNGGNVGTVDEKIRLMLYSEYLALKEERVKEKERLDKELEEL